MKVFLFQNFNLVTIFIILYLKIFKHKIFYINISRLFRNYAFINILKKFNIIWFNYQEFDLDNVETTQMLISPKHCEDISNILCHKFWSKYFEKIFLNKEFFQTCIYSGIEYKVRDAIELYLIADYLKKKESSTIILCAENSFINRKILNEQNLKNINKLRNFNILSLIKIKTFFNSLKKLITKNQKLKKNKIDEKDKNNDFKVVYFCHGILYRKLFVKDYFYSENIQSPFSASKILHIEWNKKSLSDSMIKYYKDKNLNYIIWNQKTSKFRIIKLLLIQMFQNKNIFFTIYKLDEQIFTILLKSIFQILRAEINFTEIKNIKLVLADHEILFPPEISIVCKKKNITTVSIQQRLVLSNWVKKIIFDYFFVPGQESMKNLKNRIKTPCVDNYVESYLIKTEKIFKLSSYKNNFSKNGIKCLVTDYHSDLNWYDNGRNTVNSLRINKNFYNLILDLSNKFPEVNFLVKSKDYDWLNSNYLKSIILELKNKKNIKILSDQKIWTPEYSILNSNFAFGLLTNLLDEMFFFGKPVIIYERSGYPSKIFHYGKDLLASSRSEVYSKFKMLINDLAAYNKNLDKDRKRLFFPRDNSKFKEKLERILNKN